MFATKALFAAAAVAASAAIVSPAVAGETHTVRTAHVSYSDLDLTSEAGVATLNSRIAGAVRSVCGTAAWLDLKAAAEMQTCRKDAFVSARRAMVTVIASHNAGDRLAGADASIAVGGR